MNTSYLNVPQAEKSQRTYRCMCELVSNELELDCNGIPVPKDCHTIDVVVTEPIEAPIATLIAAAGWLDDYTIVADWIPFDGAEF